MRHMRRAALLAAAALCSSSCGIFGSDPTPQDLMLSGLKRLESTVLSEVEDPERAGEACRHLSVMYELERSLFEDVAGIQSELRADLARYDTPREVLEGHLVRMSECRERFRDEMVPELGRLRSCLEDDEWSELLATMTEEGRRWESLKK